MIVRMRVRARVGGGVGGDFLPSEYTHSNTPPRVHTHVRVGVDAGMAVGDNEMRQLLRDVDTDGDGRAL